MNRIVCLGNSLVPADAAGPAVYRRLAATDLGPRIELVDGGAAGWALAGLLDGVGTVVFVDAVEGFGAPGQVVTLAGEEVAALAAATDHAVALPEVLRMMPVTCEGPPPRVWLVGLESPAGEAAVSEAADTARRLAREASHATV
jgi:hydrogenase maturation protease